MIKFAATILILFAFLFFVQKQDSDPGQAEKICVVRDTEINESSGLASCRTKPGSWWMHNDSGDAPRLFLVNSAGETKKTVRVDGAKAFDWEDMCSFTFDGQHWLLIGDVGDNGRRRGAGSPQCRLYLLREPDPALIKGKNGSADVQVVIDIEYEDGRFDCEGVAVDAAGRHILLLTKEAPQKCGLYSVPLDFVESEQKHTARRLLSPFIPFATAMDISSDGRTLAIGTMLNGIVVRRKTDETWISAFSRPGTPIELPPRRQGETLCFSVDGKQLFLNSEGVTQPLWRINVPASVLPPEPSP